MDYAPDKAWRINWTKHEKHKKEIQLLNKICNVKDFSQSDKQFCKKVARVNFFKLFI